jgi:hypothetical protein
MNLCAICEERRARASSLARGRSGDVDPGTRLPRSTTTPATQPVDGTRTPGAPSPATRHHSRALRSDVFLLGPWWNPAAEQQAIDRAHRIGQHKNVMVYRLIAAGTIEEKVVALQARKSALVDAVIDDGDLFGSALTADEVRELLA